MQKVKSERERERQEMSRCRLHCERQNSLSLRFDTEHISQTSKASQPAERSTLILKHTPAQPSDTPHSQNNSAEWRETQEYERGGASLSNTSTVGVSDV